MDARGDSMASNERAIAGSQPAASNWDTRSRGATYFGILFTTTSKITELERPHHFVDRGRFHSFRHEHMFATVENGTLRTDHLEFVARVAEPPIPGASVVESRAGARLFQ
jgi:hypothetical protein